MLRTGLVLAVMCGVACAAPRAADEAHSVQKRQATTVSDIARIFEGRTVDLTTVGAVILILLALDVVFTLVFAAAFSGRSRQDYTIPVVGEFIGNVYNSIDVVETALTFAKAEDEACKFKAVCLAERAAINNPFSSLAINTINKSLSGLYKYREAVEAGLRGDDCDLLYDQCNQHIGFF